MTSLFQILLTHRSHPELGVVTTRPARPPHTVVVVVGGLTPPRGSRRINSKTKDELILISLLVVPRQYSKYIFHLGSRLSLLRSLTSLVRRFGFESNGGKGKGNEGNEGNEGDEEGAHEGNES